MRWWPLTFVYILERTNRTCRWENLYENISNSSLSTSTISSVWYTVSTRFIYKWSYNKLHNIMCQPFLILDKTFTNVQETFNFNLVLHFIPCEINRLRVTSCKTHNQPQLPRTSLKHSKSVTISWNQPQIPKTSQNRQKLSKISQNHQTKKLSKDLQKTFSRLPPLELTVTVIASV